MWNYNEDYVMKRREFISMLNAILIAPMGIVFGFPVHRGEITVNCIELSDTLEWKASEGFPEDWTIDVSFRQDFSQRGCHVSKVRCLENVCSGKLVEFVPVKDSESVWVRQYRNHL